MRSTASEIHRANVRELRDRGMALFVSAWREIGGEGQLEINWEQYEALEAAGLLRIIAVDAGGEMVGYSVVALMPALHTSNTVCENLSMFLRSDHRGLGLGARLIAATACLAAEAKAKMRWHAKKGQALDRILPKMGYEIEDVVYSFRDQEA